MIRIARKTAGEAFFLSRWRWRQAADGVHAALRNAFCQLPVPQTTADATILTARAA